MCTGKKKKTRPPTKKVIHIVSHKDVFPGDVFVLAASQESCISYKPLTPIYILYVQAVLLVLRNAIHSFTNTLKDMI